MLKKLPMKVQQEFTNKFPERIACDIFKGIAGWITNVIFQMICREKSQFRRDSQWNWWSNCRRNFGKSFRTNFRKKKIRRNLKVSQRRTWKIFKRISNNVWKVIMKFVSRETVEKVDKEFPEYFSKPVRNFQSKVLKIIKIMGEESPGLIKNDCSELFAFLQKH